MCKLKSLNKNNWNFDAPAQMSRAAVRDVHWWLHTLPHTWAPIKRPLPSVTIFCDACSYGYGGVCDGLMTQGHFRSDEKRQSINTKECLAVYYSVRAFADHCRGCHILVRSDSSTTVSNVSHMGSMSSPIRNKIMKDLWEFVYSIDAWITIRHLAGVQKSAADAASRLFDDSKEWTVPQRWFNKVNNHFGPLDVDLFALSANHRLSWFISWYPDVGSLTVDALTVPWTQFGLSYAMPPISLVGRNFGENQCRKYRSRARRAVLGVEAMVSEANRNAVRHSSSIAKTAPAISTLGYQHHPRTSGEASTARGESVRASLRRQKFLERGQKYVVHSIRTSSQCHLESLFPKWSAHCAQWNSDPCNPSVNCVAEFLVNMFEDGYSYSTVCGSKAYLKHWIFPENKSVDNPLITKMLKGFAMARPPRVSIRKHVWDVNTMLHVLDVPNFSLPVHWLARKSAMLILIHTMCRHHTLTLLTLDKLEADDTSVTIKLTGYKRKCPSSECLRI